VTDARYTYTAGMPAARVGWLVARARSVAGIGERDLASSVGVPVRTVRRWERGDLVPTDDEVEAIASACGARLTELLPRRAVVSYDPSTGIMQMGDQAVAIPTTSLDNDTVLAAFVALVRRVRGLRLDQDVKVRQEDLDALGEVLDLDDQELEERLMRIIGMSRSQAAAVRAQLLRKRLAVPMVGMLAGLSLLGINRLFTTGSEQVKAIDGKVETVFPVPSTTTTSSVAPPASEGGAAAPAATPAPAASSSAVAAPGTQAATAAAPAESPAQVTSTTQPFVGPKFPVRTGPPASTPGRRPTTGGETAPTDPPTVGSPVTEPPSSGGGGGSPTSPVTQPTTSPPTTGQPAVTLPAPTVPPIATTDGSTGTTPVTPPPTTTSTTVNDPPPPPPPTTTTVAPIDDGHTTETTPPPAPTPQPSTPPTTISGIGTTGSGIGTTGSGIGTTGSGDPGTS
jgi:transcriptional regulator with XRE-family HTH domain